jgi:NADH-quinone oxidoreductase subunit J
MTFYQVIFYAFSTVAVSSALMVIASHNPVRGALFLVLTFFATSGIWLLLQAEFLAIILVLVYVGAVMTLFLFVVMMLRVNVVGMFEGFVRYFPLALMVIILISAISMMVLGPARFGLASMPAPGLKPDDFNNLKDLGLVLYTDYVYPFEISAVMLLTAIIAAISLSHRKPKNRKSQNPAQQIAVSAKDRLKIVKMASEKKISPLGEGK